MSEEQQQGINPMGWGRASAEKSQFTGLPEFNQFELNLCARLSQIFVDQMGIARKIQLNIDPKTGEKVLDFTIEKDSPIRQQLLDQEISGIPIRYTIVK